MLETFTKCHRWCLTKVTCHSGVRPYRARNLLFFSLVPIELFASPFPPDWYTSPLLPTDRSVGKEYPTLGRILIVFARRLWLPLLVLAGFLGACVVFYVRVEGLRPLDALFWVIHPHSIEYRLVHKSTKIFSMFVYAGVFALRCDCQSTIAAPPHVADSTATNVCTRPRSPVDKVPDVR